MDALQPLIRAEKRPDACGPALRDGSAGAYHLDVTGRQIPDPEN